MNPVLVLILMGAGWGATTPLYKIAVEEGLPIYGLLFWQLALTILLLAPILWLRGIRLRWDRAALERYLAIAVLGTVLPGFTAYTAIEHLPANIMSILISTVPMLALPLAVALRLDRFQPLRVLGLALGLCGVASLVLPGSALPAAVSGFWVGVALLSSVCYAIEANYVSARGTDGLGPIEVLCGSAILGSLLVLPMVLATGSWITPLPPYSTGQAAFGLSVVLHAITYSTYVWLVGRAGAVFASQVGYLVTLFGVFWSWVILGEVLTPMVWLALALILTGVFLVKPRGTTTVDSAAADGQTGP